MSDSSFSAEAAHDMVSSVWMDRYKFEEAETRSEEKLGVNYSGLKVEGKAITPSASSEIRDVINQAKSRIESTLRKVPESSTVRTSTASSDLEKRVTNLEKQVELLIKRIEVLEKGSGGQVVSSNSSAPPPPQEEEDEDDDFDLFGAPDEEEQAAMDEQRAKALEAYKAKKAKKPALIAKSSIILEVKPWDDETDMKELEKCVRSIEKDGLEWKASKLVPVAYGVLKLQINCVVEDDKVGTDFLEEEITAFEDYVQSVDIAAFNKL